MSEEAARRADVVIDEAARRTADDIVRVAREATADLPFGIDPSAFTAVLDGLAGEPPGASS